MVSPYERRLSIELVEAQIFLLSDGFCQSSAGDEQLLQLGLLPVVERAEGRALESLVLCRYCHVHNFPNTKRIQFALIKKDNLHLTYLILSYLK